VNPKALVDTRYHHRRRKERKDATLKIEKRKKHMRAQQRLGWKRGGEFQEPKKTDSKRKPTLAIMKLEQMYGAQPETKKRLSQYET